jgi:hypothetical protein
MFVVESGNGRRICTLDVSCSDAAGNEPELL